MDFFAGKSQDLWRSHNLPLPGSQSTTGARIEWKVRRDLALQIRWQQSDDDALVTAAHFLSRVNRQLIAPKQRQSGRCRLDFHASPKLRLITRLDWAQQPPSKFERHLSTKPALALSEEWHGAFGKRLFISGRYTLFETAATPIYLYEHDLPGVFTSVALRERGRRGYIYVRYLFVSNFELSFKLAGTEKDDSILQQTPSLTWGAQIDWRLSFGRH
jgi:hypothetical protein